MNPRGISDSDSILNKENGDFIQKSLDIPASGLALVPNVYPTETDLLRYGCIRHKESGK